MYMEERIKKTEQEQDNVPPNKKSPLRFLVNALAYILIMGGIVFGLPKFLAWELNTPYPMAAITSGSMWPALKEGDLVFVQGIINKSDISIGDIIVYRNKSNNTFVIHRVVALGDDALTTQGDANFSKDALVSYEDVVGKTFKIFGWNARIPNLGVITVYANKKINQ